jgi:hypothetical protein
MRLQISEFKSPLGHQPMCTIGLGQKPLDGSALRRAVRPGRSPEPFASVSGRGRARVKRPAPSPAGQVAQPLRSGATHTPRSTMSRICLSITWSRNSAWVKGARSA